MFGTFTGNSRRTRNVNLSGQTGNPFANTSWSPSAASNASKTVSDAHAEREKRQAERRRLRAAADIQRTWRGHRVRKDVAKSRRAAFDQLFCPTNVSVPSHQRLPLAFSLLLSFFNATRDDDLKRLFDFVREAEPVEFGQIFPPQTHASRIYKLTDITVDACIQLAEKWDLCPELPSLLDLIIRILSWDPKAILNSVSSYFTALAWICQGCRIAAWSDVLFDSLCISLQSQDEIVTTATYKAFAFDFLSHPYLYLFDFHIKDVGPAINHERLASTILEAYDTQSIRDLPQKGLLILLGHFVALLKTRQNQTQDLTCLNALYTQVTSLTTEINLQIRVQAGPESDDAQKDSPHVQPLDSWVLDQLKSLVDQEGIQSLLRDFARSLADTSKQALTGTSVLAAYILALLQAFPAQSDDTRMRLFLEQIPTAQGGFPVVRFLWQIMSQTAVFRKLKTESAPPATVLRNYMRSSQSTPSNTVEEQEWPVVLLFLELYIFMLRLSDDEDFFSGIHPRMQQNNSSPSKLQASSLSRQDVEMLTVFLKNTAFALLYNAREISQDQLESQTAARTSSSSWSQKGAASDLHDYRTVAPIKPDLNRLRRIVLSALKMLYERDSRKQFLPAGHWLMTNKLDTEGFMHAVVVEEERRTQAEEENSDDDDDGEVTNNTDDASDSEVYFTMAGQRASRHARLERLRAQQIRAQKDRRLAEMGPKLEILKHMPFAVPFETRVMLFRQFINLDRERREPDNPWEFGHPKHTARISRGRLFEDAFRQFYQIGDGLKDTISITFVDQFDNAEAGIDGGGVTKEFLTRVTSEAFGEPDKTGFKMFAASNEGLLYPDPTVIDVVRDRMRVHGLTESDSDWHDEISWFLKRFEFLGRIVGKCLYDSILVDLSFAGFFLLKWSYAGIGGSDSSYKGSINDLREMDEELYRGMLRLKNYSGDVSDLGFDFTINDQVSAPDEPRVKTVTRKLMANGDDVAVTNDNRLLYISYVARHRLVVQPRLQTAAFLRGLQSIIRPSWLSMFNQSELQRLVGGDSSEIDVEDLRRHTTYSGVYVIGDDGQEHPTIKLFWEVLREFSDAQRRDVLKYVSSTPRAPLLGFAQLNPSFSIRDSGSDETRLPSTSTCVNLLKLPRYKDKATLREKLLYAVTSGAGFDLS